MQHVRELVGKEHSLDTVSRTLRDFARGQKAAAVGALHVTCSDECERECSESFQQWFAQDLLPELKFWSRSPFRSANLGGRYEWGSVPIAEHHFATPATRESFKLLVVKINAHVCVDLTGGAPRFGHMSRYEVDSTFCGALHAMLDGASLPAIDSLKEEFLSEGKDRIATLNDPSAIDPGLRGLFAAIASTRLQARRAVLDIQDHTPASPTYYLVLPCVTLNRPQRDTELVVGFYAADYRETDLEAQYLGLGDDPGKYGLCAHHGHLQVDDGQQQHVRDARDHRALLARQWQRKERPGLADPAHRHEVAQLAARAQGQPPSVAKEVLGTLLGLMTLVAPIPTAVELFICGACGIHHIYQAYRLTHGTGSEHDARSIVDDVLTRIDGLPPAEMQRLIRAIAAQAGVPA